MSSSPDLLSPARRIFDLSIPIANLSRWPGHGPVIHSVSLNHGQGAAVLGSDRVGMLTDRIDMPLHAGTHLDAPNHFSVDGVLAGGHTVEDSELSYARGRGHLGGADSIAIFVDAAILVDVTAVMRAEDLEAGGRIESSHLSAALDRQGIEVPRDGAVLVHTGWGEHLLTNARHYFSGEPGLTAEAVEFLIGAGIRMVGADNHALEPYPPRSSTSDPYPAHQRLLVEKSIPILENVRTRDLAAAGIHRFTLVVAPLRIQGASGSPVTPVAIG